MTLSVYFHSGIEPEDMLDVLWYVNIWHFSCNIIWQPNIKFIIVGNNDCLFIFVYFYVL